MAGSRSSTRVLTQAAISQASPEISEFHAAIAANDLPKLQALYSSSSNKTMLLESYYGQDRFTPLARAAYMGRREIVEYLLGNGAAISSLHTVDSHKRTPQELALKAVDVVHYTPEEKLAVQSEITAANMAAETLAVKLKQAQQQKTALEQEKTNIAAVIAAINKEEKKITRQFTSTIKSIFNQSTENTPQQLKALKENTSKIDQQLIEIDIKIQQCQQEQRQIEDKKAERERIRTDRLAENKANKEAIFTLITAAMHKKPVVETSSAQSTVVHTPLSIEIRVK